MQSGRSSSRKTQLEEENVVPTQQHETLDEEVGHAREDDAKGEPRPPLEGEPGRPLMGVARSRSGDGRHQEKISRTAVEFAIGSC